jgi:hypothetical protein
MAVGHVSRAIEANGIPTVTIYIAAFRDAAVVMRVPRAAVTAFPMGRPLGPPGNAALQRAVLRDALALLKTAREPGTIVELPHEWRPAGLVREG